MNEKFNFRSVTGLQKLAQLENMFPNIIEVCFCQKKYICTLFVRGGITFYTMSGGLSRSSEEG